jgi:quercetin dioxygenase-like cupin family protein
MKNKKNSKESIPIGRKLARLRKRRKVSLDELSEKTGLKISHLERIEEGKDFAPVGDILKISRALTINPDELLNLQDEKKPKKKPGEKKEQKREELYQYTLLTPDAKNKQMRAFRVSIAAKTEHPRVRYQHEGEELIYVLKGEVEVKVGQKLHKLKKDDALLFNSGVKHTLKNPGNKETLLLVTIYSPKA